MLRHRRALAALAASAILCFGCSARKPVASAPPGEPEGDLPSLEEVRAERDRLAHRLAVLEGAHRETIERLTQESRTKAVLEERLESTAAALAALEERYAALELELEGAVDEVLRSKASLRSVQNRALTVSRLAEVRVEIQAVPSSDHPEIATRVRRANDLLERADRELAAENVGGAAYLTERAAALVRQAKTASKLRSGAEDLPEHLALIVPPRSMEVAVAANLRQGPSIDEPRISLLAGGEQVTVHARVRGWYQVETKRGVRGWVYGALLR